MALTFSSVQLIPFLDNTMLKNVSLSMLNWHFSALRVSPRSFNLTMTYSNCKSCSFWSLPCTMMSPEMFSCPSIPASAVWTLYWYCSEVELTPNNSLRPQWVVNVVISQDTGERVSPLKVKFGEYFAANYALSNLINSRDWVSGSPYCLISPSHVNAKTDVTPWLRDNNNWINPWCGPLCRFNNV